MSRTQSVLLILGLAVVAILSSYSYLEQQNDSTIWYSQAQVNQGETIFLDQCASCHGRQAQGAENWTQADAAGNRPAPPLNGSGHAWHHSLANLTQTVTQGRGAMPAFNDTLTQAQITAVLAWTQSRWPSSIYTAWLQANP